MYDATIIADSLAPNGARLTTMRVRFPRFILAEFNTHRMFSRNSASSRAIPVARRIREVRENPFVPSAFLENKKGMQGGAELDEEAARKATEQWLFARDRAADAAEALTHLNVHKQYANRLLEPFLWHTCVVSATEWSNFFAQRCHPDAQPEIQCIAFMMRDAIEAKIPLPVESGNWHLPYVDVEDIADLQKYAVDKGLPETGNGILEMMRRVSVARCARVSYRTHTETGDEGDRSVSEDLCLFDRLLKSGHWSPFEHVATPAESRSHRSGNFIGWGQYRKGFIGENR